MILYLDTSALVKLYFQEIFTAEVVAKCEAAQAVATSSVAYAETLSAIYRKKRESDIDDATVSKLVQKFQSEWNGLVRVRVNDELNNYLDTVFEKYLLRGFDAIHLASALAIHEQFPEGLFFGCFDERLNAAAREAGLPIF